MDWTSRGIGLRIGGHRGAPDVAPENTIAGFEAAEAAGVEYVENDIHRTSDGVLVVIHDDTVNRTTDGRGRVATMTLADVRALDAGARFGASFAGMRVPTFEEFMAWIEARAPLGGVIEAKADGVGAEIAQRIARSPSREHLSICSFKDSEIRAAKAAVPDVPCFLLFDSHRSFRDALPRIVGCGADGADLGWQWASPELVGRMRERGLGVGGGTANDERAVKRCLELGVDFVDSDRPAIAVTARNDLSRVEQA